jgi:hypothetical protein
MDVGDRRLEDEVVRLDPQMSTESHIEHLAFIEFLKRFAVDHRPGWSCCSLATGEVAATVDRRLMAIHRDQLGRTTMG